MRAVCKPSSVLDDHLSRPKVAIGLKRLSRERDGPPHILSYQSCTRWGLHSGRVARPLVSSYLTFPPLRPSEKEGSRYLSVALSLESPPLAFHQHPALRCSDFPRVLSHPRPPGSLTNQTNYTISGGEMSNKVVLRC